jgi:Uma2 family endonuclease
MALVYDDSEKSVEEYFALMQSDPDHRYEYIDGHIYMMTGGTKRHSAIGSNLSKIIGNHLDDSPCMVYDSDACVQVAENRYVCPDLTVSCDPRDQDNSDGNEFEVIKHPGLVMEVLSRSTKSVDKGDKLMLYLDVPTIQEYVVIDTKTPRVLLYRREEPERWSIYILGLEHEIELTSIGLRFPVAQIYKKTRFARQDQ